MTKKSKPAIRVKGLGALSVREYRSNLASLKRAGLVSKNIDARSHKPTRYMREQMAKYSNVLEGTAKAVKVPRKNAREYKDSKFDRVVVRVQKGSKARYSKKKGAILVERKTGLPGVGNRIEEIPPNKLKISGDGNVIDVRDLKPGEVYAISNRNGSYSTTKSFATKEQLMRFIFQYENSATNPFRNAREYITILGA